MTKDAIHKLLIGLVYLWLQYRHKEEPGMTWATHYIYMRDLGIDDAAFGMKDKRIAVTFEIDEWPKKTID